MPRDTSKMQQRTRSRHEAVIKLFDTLYNKKRKRYDDVVIEVADLMHYSPSTVEKIYQSKL